MKKFRPWNIIQVLGALFMLWWLWTLLQGGPELLPSVMVLILPALGMFIYDARRRHTPPKSKKRVNELENVTFDADAAIERYLAAKEQPDASATRKQNAASQPGRPIFGRRGDRK